MSVADFIEDTAYHSPEKITEECCLHEDIRQIFKNLDTREQKIISHRFGLDNYKYMTLEELGGEMGFSKERIRQLESKALLKLRHNHEIKPYKDYII